MNKNTYLFHVLSNKNESRNVSVSSSFGFESSLNKFLSNSSSPYITNKHINK